MKIGLIHSLDFSKEAVAIQKKLETDGHVVSLCYSAKRIKTGDLSVDEVSDMKNSGKFSEYTISKDLIKWNWERIQKDEAILVVNITKNGIEDYIGGNTLLEMGFAYVSNKKIFLWNNTPDMPYTDELLAMKPVVINQDVSLIK